MDNLRSLVFIKNGLGEQLVEPNLMEENYQKLVNISQAFTNGDLIRSLEVFQKALEKLKVSSIPSLPLELALVEICTVPAGPASTLPEEGRIVSVGNTSDAALPAVLSEDTSSLSPALTAEEIMEQPNELVVSEAEITGDISKLKEKWTYVLETIRPYNFSLEALLRSISVRECTQTAVIMEVPYSFHQRILEAPKNRDLLESIFSEILGRPIRITTVLGNRPARKEDIANIEVAADDEIIRAAAEIFNSDSIN